MEKKRNSDAAAKIRKRNYDPKTRRAASLAR
jgi:hypothetical protein